MKHVFPLLNFKALSPDQISKIHVSKKRTLLRVSVEFERRAECKNTSTRKRKGTKARDILKMYPEEKAKALMKRLHDRGLWYFDPDFDGDTEDHGSWSNFSHLEKHAHNNPIHV